MQHVTHTHMYLFLYVYFIFLFYFFIVLCIKPVLLYCKYWNLLYFFDLFCHGCRHKTISLSVYLSVCPSVYPSPICSWTPPFLGLSSISDRLNDDRPFPAWRLKIYRYLKTNGHKACSITWQHSSKTKKNNKKHPPTAHPVAPVHRVPRGHSSGPVWRSKRLR